MSAALLSFKTNYLRLLTQALDFADSLEALLSWHQEQHGGKLKAVCNDGNEYCDNYNYLSEASFRIIMSENRIELLCAESRQIPMVATSW